MVYPKGNKLAELFLNGFKETDDIVVTKSGNPLSIEFSGVKYNVYLKCISHGGGHYNENTTRAQLPKRAEFDAFRESPDRFIFLGYDPICDVMVCWDPVTLKPRLNKKEYVSLFCRKALQESVSEGNVQSATLTNGAKFVLFKRSDIAAFLSMIEVHFPGLKTTTDRVEITELVTKMAKTAIVGILSCVEDDMEIKSFIDTFPKKNSILDLTAGCMNTFGKRYHNMKFSEWTKLIKSYLK